MEIQKRLIAKNRETVQVEMKEMKEVTVKAFWSCGYAASVVLCK